MVKILSEIERSMGRLINKNSILVRGKVIEQFSLGNDYYKIKIYAPPIGQGILALTSGKVIVVVYLGVVYLHFVKGLFVVLGKSTPSGYIHFLKYLLYNCNCNI